MVRPWKKTKEYTLLAIQDKSDPEKLYRTTEGISIVHQMENLLTFLMLKEKVKMVNYKSMVGIHRIEDGFYKLLWWWKCTFKELIED